jgi:diguanylate cyclase (GGDEF)-like protein
MIGDVERTGRVGALPARLLDAVPDAIIVLDASLRVLYANRAAAEFIDPASAVDGEDHGMIDASKLITPDDAERVLLELVPVFTTPGATCSLRTRVVSGRETRPIEVFLVNMVDDPDVRGVVASFRDLRGEEALQRESEAKQRLLERNEALRAELLEREAFQARLLQIQQSISRRMPVNEVLSAIVQGAYELLGDEVIELELDPLDADGHPTVVESRAGLCRFLGPRSQPSPLSPIGDAARRADALVVGPQGDASAHEAERVPLGMAVPIRDRHRVIGSLTVATQRAGRSYRVIEREMLVNLAEHASTALLDARTVESVQAAFTDPLTGLPNRALLMDRLAQSMERCARQSVPLAVLFVDLARFKGINDGYGHAVGDEVLSAIGRRLARTLRLPDAAARLGGDEFVVVLEDTDDARASTVADRLLDVIREPIDVGGRTLYADATIGIAVAVDSAHQGDGELLLRHADIAMYRGKTSGRSVVFFESAMQSELVARQELESELRGAITSRTLEAALQPIVDLHSGDIVGVEALARWQDPRGRVARALDFVTTAERIGAVVELDRIVWAWACNEVAQLPPNGRGQPLELSLNLSARHLLERDLVSSLSAILDDAGIAPHRVELEITETELMNDVATAVEQMWALQTLGVRLAIDDFGTGYSSLAYLQALPVRALKIDRAFVNRIDVSSRGRQLVKTMVTLAHGLGLRVVAEGIEHEAELRALRAAGADFGQGFWLARPLDPPALRALLERGEPLVVAPAAGG